VITSLQHRLALAAGSGRWSYNRLSNLEQTIRPHVDAPAASPGEFHANRRSLSSVMGRSRMRLPVA